MAAGEPEDGVGPPGPPGTGRADHEAGPSERAADRCAREAEPPVAASVFGASIETARRYADLLTGPGVERGLVGPREPGRIWSRHLLNCAVVGQLVPDGAAIADVGSGAGLPGIPLALVRPDCTVVLIEPLLRRATFLTEVIDDLGLRNCRVVRSRAEDLVPRRSRGGRSARPARAGGYSEDGQGSGSGGASACPPGEPAVWEPMDVVTSRAVAPLDVLSAWCAPLLRRGGLLLAMKGSSAVEEIRAARAALAALRLTDVEAVTAGVGILDPPTVVVRARRRD